MPKLVMVSLRSAQRITSQSTCSVRRTGATGVGGPVQTNSAICRDRLAASATSSIGANSRWRPEGAGRGFQGFQLGFLLLGIVGVILFRLVEDAGEGARGAGKGFVAG